VTVTKNNGKSKRKGILSGDGIHNIKLSPLPPAYSPEPLELIVGELCDQLSPDDIIRLGPKPQRNPENRSSKHYIFRYFETHLPLIRFVETISHMYSTRLLIAPKQNKICLIY
jgi:hypothetical protein